MTEENITNKDQKIKRSEDQTDEVKSEVRSPKSEVHKHGLFHHKCKECEEYKAGWQRAQADYQNLKKEVDNMRSEWARMSEQQILEDFLPVYDNFNKAFVTANNTDEQSSTDNTDKKWQNWKKGIEFIMKQYWKVLQDHGIEKIKTVGEMFSPELHEAVGEEPGEEEGKILKEVEAGYVMKGKVIKPAKVIVAKK